MHSDLSPLSLTHCVSLSSIQELNIILHFCQGIIGTTVSLQHDRPKYEFSRNVDCFSGAAQVSLQSTPVVVITFHTKSESHSHCQMSFQGLCCTRCNHSRCHFPSVFLEMRPRALGSIENWPALNSGYCGVLPGLRRPLAILSVAVSRLPTSVGVGG